MDYTAARSLIHDGDIVFVQGATTLSKLIQYFTKSKYSHIAICFWIKVANVPDRLMVIEAQGKTHRRIINLSFYSEFPMDIIACPLNWQVYATNAFDGLGRMQYGYLQAIYTGIRDYFINTFHVRLPTLNFSGEICSEFVARCLNLPDASISPQDVFEALQVSGHKIALSIS